MSTIYIGKEGLKETFQEEFPEDTECVHCKGNARIGIVVVDDGPGPSICDLHKGRAEKYWPHDSCAIATYFCERCREATSLYNQA